jgi:hypothetical protein
MGGSPLPRPGQSDLVLEDVEDDFSEKNPVKVTYFDMNSMDLRRILYVRKRT